MAYCEECTEYLCEEHRRAHSKTRLTKGHNVYNVLLSLIDFDSTLDCAIFHLNCAIFDLISIKNIASAKYNLNCAIFHLNCAIFH